MTHKPPKIVHIIIGLNVGGAELMLKRLVLNSQAKGEFKHEVVSLTDLGVIGADLKKAGIPVYILNMKSVFSILQVYFSLNTLLKQLKPDVVQTWMYHADFIGGLAAKRAGVKNIIWGIRTTDVSQGSSRLTVTLRNLCAKLSYHVPSKIICAAHAAKDLHEKIGYDATKMVVIPNGFELDKLTATEDDRKLLRKELDLSDTDIVIGSIGRFNEVKHQKIFIEIAADVIKKNPHLKFVMVGRDNDESNPILMGWLHNYNVSNSFRLLGQRNDIPQCLKVFDIFCLHSKTEGFPNVLVEALAIGLPCVSTDVGDAKHIMKDLGLISPSNNAKNLAETLEKVIEDYLNQSVEEKNIFEIKARNHIEQNYSMDKLCALYSDIWKK
ncbi:glycosyltransferase family 4 protein [Acinetobacter johnsonii]|uniref:glycosyltransferase family 4 protein n=1 Tax=Acinetobacter johnsonii TaxID=40214 RepID=UPI001F3BF2F5|nr:glycosyltransferase [Acinetobacter johnsonii]MCF7641623.1 glycosyltransferase [Acinetobacter johnsonii]